jgi:hypothetical protein
LWRNHQWTGNPIHPLYGHLFRQAGQPPPQPSGGEEREENIKPALTHVIYRHMVFGESFAAIAALPLRIFFQGRDGDPALFDGRLNPVLLPLCLAALGCLAGRRHDRSLRTEVFLLFCFSWLYIIIGAFAVDMRIRYILPAVPPLVLLSAYGLHVIVACIREAAGRWRKVMGFLVPVAGLILGSLWSADYVLELYTRLEPLPVLTGAVAREAYIDRFRFEQPAMRYINRHLPPDAVVLFQFIGGRGYYCDREYRLGDGVFASLLSRSGSSQEVAGMLHGMGITHLLVQRVFFDRWNRQALPSDQQARLERFFHEHTRKLFSRNQTEVIELAPQA